jgi:hypothetical protein
MRSNSISEMGEGKDSGLESYPIINIWMGVAIKHPKKKGGAALHPYER